MKPQTNFITFRSFLRPLLHRLVSIFALSLLTVFPLPALASETSLPSPAGTSSGLVLDGARSSKLKAQSYQEAGDLNNATVNWVKAAKAYDQVGMFGEATLAWTEAATLHEKQGRTSEQTIALIHLGHSLQQVGQNKKALTTLHVARALAEQIGQPVLQATAIGQLAAATAALGNEAQAITLYIDALALARKHEQSALVAVLLNDLGNTLTSQGRSSEAISAYMESTILAKGTGQAALSMTALTNAAMASLDDGQVANAKDRLELAYRQAKELPDSHDKAYGMISLALAYDDLRPQVSPEHVMLAQLDPAALPGSRGIRLKAGRALTGSEKSSKPDLTAVAPRQIPTMSDQQLFGSRSEELLRAARLVASRIGDPGAESYAFGYLGQLSEQNKQYGSALDLTRKAMLAAQQANAPESLYRWHWQTGRLLNATDQHDEAIKAYRRAVSTLQPIRHEFSTGYNGRRHSFRDSIGPVFFELADLLLKEAAAAKDPQQQALLIQARDTSELFKAAELQDYFKDDCVKSARSQSSLAETLPAGAAIIYPIILPDRLELLVNITGRWTRVATSVPVDRLTEEVRAFRRSLQDRTSRQYLAHGRQLYTWIIKPLDAVFAAAHIDTLVFVPDGPLRTIPMAALHDGEQFLIDRFALATTPGMDLTDFRPIDRTGIRMLSLGLSDAVQGFPPLPNVQSELDAVQGLYAGTSLLNRQFLVPSVETEMRDHQYSVVHIASHGLVGNEARDSFLLAYDDKITMDRLSQLIGLYQYRKSALELLTLSACETAVGDDRAALGLAGVAVKAGARSALASLWFIDDEATSELVTEFYRQLQDPSISKAVALQRAQQKIAKDPFHDHPSYWAPFLLINNWL